MHIRVFLAPNEVKLHLRDNLDLRITNCTEEV